MELALLFLVAALAGPAFFGWLATSLRDVSAKTWAASMSPSAPSVAWPLAAQRLVLLLGALLLMAFVSTALSAWLRRRVLSRFRLPSPVSTLAAPAVFLCGGALLLSFWLALLRPATTELTESLTLFLRLLFALAALTALLSERGLRLPLSQGTSEHADR